MTKVILDASALLALIQNESGADEVEKLLGYIVMSAVNVSEVAAVLLKSNIAADDVKNCILPFISFIISFDEEQAFLTAELRERTKEYGLSLGDRACIALGMIKKLPIYTADKIWHKLNIKEANIKLIR